MVYLGDKQPSLFANQCTDVEGNGRRTILRGHYDNEPTCSTDSRHWE